MPFASIPDSWFREIVDSAPDAIVMIDSDGKIILTNSQTQTLFKYNDKELIGQPVEVLIPERLRVGHHIHRDSYFGEPKVREMGADLALTAVRKDGIEIPVEISLSPLRTDQGVFATASIRDASSRKKAQDQVSRLLEAAPDAMVIIDRTGAISLVNAQTERLFGYKREALIGQPVEFLVPESLRAGHLAHRNGYFKEPNIREMGAGRELAGRRKDGSEFPIEISLSPLETETGLLAMAAVRDVSDRKIVEEKLKDYARNLEASNRELEQFAYVASHDLQAPLRNVVSYSQLLERELPELSEKGTQYFDHIRSNASHMRDLILDILKFSRITQTERTFSPTNLTTVMAESLELLHADTVAANAVINVPKLPTISGDASPLIQLFQNLLGNAIKFRRPEVSPIVDVSYEIVGKFVKLYIKDNGIGMNKEYQASVFKIFNRLHSSAEYSGTGIGLAICKKIVEQHGGEISVVSNEDFGCCFTLTLSIDTVAASVTPNLL